MQDLNKKNINLNSAMEWLTISKWLTFSKIFFLIGVIIFIITSLAGAKGGILASYTYMTVGVFITMYMVSLMVSMNISSDAGIIDIIKAIGPLLVPGLFLLIPLFALIFIFYTKGSIIEGNTSNLPSVFYSINTAAFISILIQAVILINFYSNEIKMFTTNKPHEKKWLYISGLVLASIITGAISIELYVIITSLLTAG